MPTDIVDEAPPETNLATTFASKPEEEAPPPQTNPQFTFASKPEEEQKTSINDDVISSVLEPLIRNLMSRGMSLDEAREAIRSYAQNKDS